MPKLDNLSVLRCVQVVRRLLFKNRDIGLFCNLSSATLTDSGFPRFLEFVEANRAIAPALVFEFTQGAVRAMGPIEHESLAALADRGFRFSMDNLTDLRVEPRELNERGFRFVKAPAALLLNRVGAASTDIHPADLSDLLGRFGIDLIAERIEAEGAVVDLLDYDVRFGQGFLFSPPRPVRAEALDGFEPAVEKSLHRVRMLFDLIVGGEYHVGDELIDERRRCGDDAPLLGFLQRVTGFQRADIAVDLISLDRGAGRRHATDRHHGDAVGAPAFLLVDAGTDPVGQRADRGAAEFSCPSDPRRT